MTRFNKPSSAIVLHVIFRATIHAVKHIKKLLPKAPLMVTVAPKDYTYILLEGSL